MPKISELGRRLPTSAIRKLVPYADAAKEKGIKVYHLNIGQPDLPTPHQAVEVLRKAEMDVVSYTHSAGNLSYRKKLVEYYKQHEIHVDVSDIIVTISGSEALNFAFSVCLDEGDEVIIPEPYYTNYNAFAIQTKTTIKTIPADIETAFALPPIEEFEKVITPKTKAILICNPNNPTGYLYSKAEIEALGMLAKKHKLFLFADEVYREFCYDGQVHTSVLHIDGIEDNAIIIDSVSKRYSACGARIGAIVSKNKEVMAASMKMAQARLSPPYFAQIFAEAAIDVPDSFFAIGRAEYDKRRNYLINALNNIEGCRCPNPTGAFYSILELPIDDSDRFCQWLLEEFSYNGETVMLAPATGFYSDPEKGKKQARVAYVLNVEDLQRAVKCLEEALKIYPGRTI